MSKARDLADTVSTGGILDDGTVSVSEISDLTVTAAELNNVAGVNSDVQTQLDLKAPLASPTFTGTVTASALTVAASTSLVKLEDTDTNAYAQIATDGSGIVNIAADEGNTGASPRITFDVSTTERMRIDSNGRVGIGVTAMNDATLEIQPATDIPQIKLTQNNVPDGGDGWKFHNSGPTGGNLAIIREGSGVDTEYFRLGTSGQIGLSGANYGTAGQVLTSGGSGAAPTWADAAGGATITATADGAISAGDAVALQSNGTVKSVQETVTEQTPLNVTFNSNAIALSPGNPDYGFGGNAHYHEDTKTVFYFWNTGGDVYMTSIIYDSNNDNWSTRQQNVFIGDGFSGDHLSSDYNPNTGHVLISWKDGSGFYRFVGMYVYKNVNNNLFDYYKTSQSTYGTVRSGGTEQIAIACSFTDNHFRLAWLDTNAILRVFTISVTGTSSVSVSHIGYGDIDTNMGNTEYLSMAWDSNNNKFGLTVRHGNQSDYGYIYYFSTSTSNGSILTSQFAQYYNGGYVTYPFVEFNPEDECFVVMFDYASGAGIKQVDVNANGSLTVVGGSSSVVNIDGWHSQWWRDMRYDSSSKKIIYGRRSAGATSNFIVGRITTSGSSPTAANTESNLHTNGLNQCLGIVSMPNVSRFAGISEESGGGLFIKAFESASTTSNNTDWIGFASEAIADTASGDILVVGSTDENQSGLTIGSTYYVQPDGSLATTTTDAIKAGKAIAATKLLITEGNA